MSRKANYGLNYDDDYEDYEEDYDNDDGYEEHGEAAEVNAENETVKPGMWRCFICTYDNDESMTYCDICGVLRFPPSNSPDNIDKKTVGGTCKDSGVSQLAKSLFASVPRRTPKMAVISQPQSYTDDIGGVNKSLDSENVQQHCQVISRGLSAPRSQRLTTIAPFKFDVPSPDDVVSSQLHTTKITPKGAPPAFSGKNAATTTQFTERQPDNNFASKGKGAHWDYSNSISTDGGNDLNVSRNNVSAVGPSSSEGSDKSSSRNTKLECHMGESSSLANGGKPESVTTILDNMSLNSKSESVKRVVRKKTNTQYKPENWMLPDKEGAEVLTQLNLAIVGHVDSGKSTLSGRLLHLLGQISQKQMHKYEKEAKLQGKGSFAYAWALDESAEERERGITMTVAVAYFDTKRYHVVLLDSPGHKDFVPNMISGATQADAAVLVIDASIGAFEVGMDGTGGQSREHAQVIRSFGVERIVVAINKMDVVGYSKERFELIKHQVGLFLRQCGFKESFISWIPLSAMENQNLVAAASDVRLNSWYKGPHLLDVIDALPPPRRDYEKPLVMPICDVIKTHSMGQVLASGKLEAGALRNGYKVMVMPSEDVATVRSIERNYQPCTIARAGENVAVALQGIDVGHVIAGGVLCHPDFPVHVASHLELKILVLDVKVPILIGSQLEFHIHHAKEAARVVRIVSLLDPKTGKETKKAPRCLLAKQRAVIEVALQETVCVEEFSSCKALGRVFLRASGKTVAAGIVNRVIEDMK